MLGSDARYIISSLDHCGQDALANCTSSRRNPGKRLSGTPAPMHVWKGAESLEITGDSWGSPHAQAVLLLHGGGQTRHAWRSTAKKLAAAGYYAIAIDARGHGDSNWSADAHYDQSFFVLDLQLVCAALNVRRPVLIGASFGGNTCLIAAGESHLDAAALILVDIVPQTERAGFDRIKAFMLETVDGFDTLEEVADAVARFRPGVPRPENLEGLKRTVRRWPDGRLRWHWDPRFLEGREQDFATRTARLSAAARRLTAPTLLVRGAGSDVVSERGAQEFLELCPHADYLNVPDAGHMLADDGNDIFGKATLDFLARRLPAASAGESPRSRRPSPAS